ncbi:MAG TPA: M23 family metallopeptidase [Alphaproteobacteria bacterium]|nr:M23 family metallopeptidase [Alphaproteobacteria bacterium]
MLKTRLGIARASSLRTTPIFQLLFAATLVMGIGVTGHALHPVATSALQVVANSVPAQAIATARTAAIAAVNQKPINATREAELDDGQTFAELLTDSGASDADAAAAMNALSKVYNLRSLKAGQAVTLAFARTTQNETLTGATFLPEATKEVSVARNAQGVFTANVRLVPIVRQRLAAQGEIRSSLYEAGDRSGVPHAIMASLIHIYSHDIDFQRDIHPGDHFEVLYDQPMTAQGKAVGEGDVIYAALNVGGKVHPIYRVMFSDKSVDYFDDRGQSVRRALLRTPVAAAHITSGFGMRMHPILGYSKMHKGVDFGANIGTPIFAAGNGTVEEIGFKNGYGRYIRIRHSGNLSTAYAHMSRFNANVHRGGHVNQGEVIAYVGMSGRATGPHLHFEVLINGNQVNPLSVNLPTGRTLDGKLLADFRKGQVGIKQQYSTILAKKAAPQPATPKGLIQASASGPAYATQPTQSCGLRGGC